MFFPLGETSNLAKIFQMDWNHHLDKVVRNIEHVDNLTSLLALFMYRILFAIHIL